MPSMLKGKRIFVAGGSGSIGSELVRQLSEKNSVYVLDMDETGVVDLCEELQIKGLDVQGSVGNVRDWRYVEHVISEFKPDLIINAAAYKHVKALETVPMEAVRTNVEGNYNLLCAAKGAKFVFVSTDKAVSANSVMGTTKRLSEIITKNYGGIVVRFGNVMGSRGSVIPFWQNQINRGDPITVTDERMERYMMTIQEACSLVIEAAEKGKPGETYILDMGRKVNVLDLAKQVVAAAGRGEIKMIGMRPGETLTEELMTPEEEKRAVKTGRFHVFK